LRARDLGIEIGRGTPGPNNAITDVAGVLVGHTTLIAREGELVVGRGPVRTGVTVVVPHQHIADQPLYAGCHRLNGNGELTGLEWVRESGTLTTPIALTNTHSVGVVHDALIATEVRRRGTGAIRWSLPVVGETCDAMLNDINGMHVRPEHLEAALAGAAGGPVAEGNVGGGTGMICHEFKGGIGTSSRIISGANGGFTVGVLVQANYGPRDRLTVDGVPVGRQVPTSEIPSPYDQPSASVEDGSIIAVVATDAPLLPTQCARLAQRAGLGIARVGGVASNSSGDLFICFSTGNRGLVADPQDQQGPITSPIEVFATGRITELFVAVVDATEEAILNALVAAETMTGRDGITAHALPHDRLLDVMARFGRRS
jgi:D-aminopeptidase